MANSGWTDETLVAAIQAGGGKMEQAMAFLYRDPKYRRIVFDLVLKNGGSGEDAKDVLQESMAQLILSIQARQYEGRGALSSYLYGIAYRKWAGMRRLRDAQHEDLNPGDGDGPGEDPDAPFLQEEFSTLFQQALGELGESCRKILQLILLEYSMKEIAAALGYGSDDVVKNLANRCRGRFRELLTSQPRWSELLTNFGYGREFTF